MVALLYLTDGRIERHRADLSNTNPILAPAADGKDAQQLILDCYLSSIQVLAECVEAAWPLVGSLYYEPLVRIRRRLGYDGSARPLLETRESLETTLAAYADQARACYDLRSKDLERILEILSRIEEVAAEKKDLLEPLVEEVRKRLMAGRETSTVDDLTGLANRRELERQVNLRLAGGRQFCVLFFDIDHFCPFNQKAGAGFGGQG